MTVQDLTFPVLAFNEGVVVVEPDADSLTTCSAQTLRGGWYTGLLLVDQTGLAVTICSASRLHPVGRLWGLNIWLEQTIKVHLLMADNPAQLTIEELRKKTLGALRFSFGAIDPDYAREMKQRFREAASAAEIISLVAELDDASKVRK